MLLSNHEIFVAQLCYRQYKIASMTVIGTKSGFITDAFVGALKKNDETNKEDTSPNKEPAPDSNKKNDTFITDAFREALKINEERNKK
jgi:hypothetical protein